MSRATATAPWWDNSSNRGAVENVVAHTPDPKHYHPPGYEDGPRPGGGPSGISGAVVPRARNDGSSRGFDHNYAGVVIVDPQAPDGGSVVDMSKLTNERINEAIMQVDGNVGHGAETDGETFAVLAMLGKPVSAATLEETTPEYLMASLDDDNGAPRHRPNRRSVSAIHPIMKNAYVTPKADSNGQQMVDAPQPRACKRRVERVPQVQTVDGPSEDTRATTHTATAPAPDGDGAFAEEQRMIQEQETFERRTPVATKQASAALSTDPVVLLTMLAAQMGMTVQPQQQQQPQQRQQQLVEEDEEIIDEQEDYSPPPAPPRQAARQRSTSTSAAYSRPPASAIRRQPQLQAPRREMEREAEDDGSGAGDDALHKQLAAVNLPFLTSGPPLKPKQTAVFDLGKAGIMRKRYHQIITNETCMVLVYDTRYEDGEQWVPPMLDDEPLEVQLVGEKNKMETFIVSSVGLQFSLGCLDCVLLVRHEDATPQMPNVGDDVSDIDISG